MPKKVTANGLKFTFDDNATDEEIQEALSNYFDNIPQKENTEKKKDISSNGVENSLGGKSYIGNTNQEWNTRLGKETDFTRSVAGGKLPTLDINNTQQPKSVVQSFIEKNIPEQYRTKEVLGRANNIIKTSNPKEAAKKLIQLKTEIDENEGNILTAKKALQDDSLLEKNKSLDYNAQVLDIYNNEKIKYLDEKIANGGDNTLSEYEENIILENSHKQALQTEAGQRRLKVQEASQDIKKAVEEDYNYFKDVIQKNPFSPQAKKYLEEKAGELKNDILDPTTNTEALKKYIGLKKSILDNEYKKKLDSEIGDVSFMGSKDYGRLIQEQIPTDRQKQLENDYNESLISLQETLLPIAQVKATQQVISEAKSKNVLPSTHKIGEIVLGVMNLPEYDKAIRMKKEGIPYTPQQLFEMDRMGNEALKNFVAIYKPDADNGDEVAKDLVKLANSKIATRDEVLKRNPEYLKEQYSRLISDEIAKNPKEYFGVTVNGINTSGVQKALGLYDIDDEMINKAGKNLGLDQNIVTKISDEDIKSGNIIGAFTSGIIGEPITGIKGLYQRVKNKAKGYSWETANALADRYTDKEEFFSKIYKTPEADEIQQGATKIDTDPESETYMQDIKNTNAGDWNINAYNLLNSMFYGAGMVIGLGKGGMITGKLLQGSKAIGTEASLASKAEKTLEAGYKTGRIEEMTKAQEKANILLSKSEKAKEFADNAGMFMYGYITGIDRNLKSAEQLYAGQENAEQKKLLHAGLFSFIENAVEQMGFSEVKFVRNLLSPQNKAMYELVENISKNGIKGVEKKELLDGVKNVIKSGARIGKDISSEVVEEIATNVGGKVIELVTGAKQDEDSNFLKEQFDTAVHTVLQMVLTTGLGEIRQKAPMRETLQMQIALNPYGVIQSIKQQQEAGKITEEEAIKKIKVVNTLVDIYNELPQSDAYSGRRLTKQDRIQYLNEGLKIRLAKNELENIKDEVQKKRLQDIISEAYKKQVEILEKGVPKNKGINPNRVDAERTLEEQTIKAKSDTPILVVEKDGKFEVNNPNGNIETFDTREEADSRVVEISNNNVANTTVGTKIQDNSIEIPIQKIEEINKRNGVKISQKEDGSFDVQLENESDDKIKNNLSIARAQLELAELRDNMRIQNPIFAESGSNENKDIEDTSQYGKLPNGVEFKITRLDNGNYQYNFNDGFEEIYTKEEHEKSVKDKEIEIIDVSELTKPITIVDNKNISSSEQTELVGDKKQVDGVNNKLEEQIQSPQKGVLTDEIYEQYLEDGDIDNDILFSIVEKDFMGEELNKKEKTLLNNETDNVRKIQNELLNKFTTDITKDDIEKATGAKGVISKRNKYVIAYKIANRGGKKIKDVLNTKEQILYNERKKEIDKLIKDDPNLFLPKLKEETKEQKEAKDKDLEERKKRFQEQQQKLLEGKKTAIGEKMRSAGERISSDGDIIYRQTENVTKDKPKGDIGYVQFAEINGVNIGEEYQYVLIEEDDLQASHTIDYTKANDKHFIIEAQPKDRTGDDKSIKASDRIAQKVDLSKATDSPIAYIGAPIVNDRGEVIQGNNRAIGIKKHYNNKSNQYKNDLADNANKYGFSKEQVLGMNKPVLVRVLKVSDDRAIELGNYVMSDLESASDSTINATRLIAKMSEADKAKLNELLIDEDTEKSITAIITKNKDKILSLIAPYLNDGQISGAVDRNNEVTNEFINEISKVPKAILFDGTTDTQKRAFDKLPTRLQNAILRATPQILSVSRKDNIIDQLAQAIEIYAEYLASGGNIPINVYLNSAQLFRPAINDMLLGEQKFVSKIVQELDNVKYVKDLQPFMTEYAKEINGDPQINLFTGEAVSPKNKQEAINKINKENEQQQTTKQQPKESNRTNTQTKSNIGKETKSNGKDAKLELGQEDDRNKPIIAFQLSTQQDTIPFETNDTTKATKENIQAKFKDAIVVQSESELPQAIQDEIRNQKVEGEVKGVYYNGEVYMVADNIKTLGEAVGTYRHERLGHKGVIDHLGDKLNDYTSRIIDNAKGGQLKKLQDLAKRYGLPTDISKLSEEQKQLLGEEYIAMISENKAKYPKAWNDLVSFVREVLRELGINLQVTDTEIEALLGKVENKILGKENIIEKISNQVKDFLNLIGIKASKVSLSNIKSRFQFIIPDNAKGDKYNRNNLKKFLSEKEADYIKKRYPSLFSDSDNFIAYAKKYIPIKSNIIPLLGEYGNVVLEDFYNKTYGEKVEEKREEHLHPKDLLAQVGYQLGDVILNVDKANELYLDYYLGEGSDKNKGGSIICTLHSKDRFRDYHVMWVIKDNAINQPRAFVLTQENLTPEWKQYLESKGRKNEDGTYNLKDLKAEREDPFGTSVLSMQINKKGGEHRLINRYNHDLQKSYGDNKNPDRTFDLDLNKLAKGLSKSIYNFFNLSESKQNTKDELKGFVQDINGAFYKYTEEYNGVYYGEGFYIKNGEATILDSGSQKMVDGFVINANGKVENVAEKFREFPYGNIEKVNYIKGKEISIETKNGTFVFETDRGVVSKYIWGNDDFIFDKLNELYGAEKDDNGNIVLNNIYGNKELHYFWNDKIVKIRGYADFENSQITNLGNLQSIGGNTYFSNSQITNLGNLQSIGGGTYFSNSQITNLGNLQSIGGDTYFNNSQITNLGNLQSIGGDTYFRYSQITNLGNLQSIGGNVDFENSQITNLGNLQSIGGNTYFNNSQITNLGNLQSIGGDTYFGKSQHNAELLKSIKTNDVNAKEKANEIKEIFKKAHEDFLESIKNNDGKTFNDFLPDEYKLKKEDTPQIKFKLNKTENGQVYLSINENGSEYTNTSPDNIQQNKNEEGDKFQQAKNNLKEAWDDFKNVGFANMPEEQFRKDLKLLKTLLDYIIQSGLKNINDIREAIKKKLNAKSLNKDLEKRIEKAVGIISGGSTYSNEVLKSLSNILSDNNIEAVKNLVKQNINNGVFDIDKAITDIENKRLKRETKDAIIDYLQAVKDDEEGNVKMSKRDRGIITDNGNTAMENDSINKILSTEIDLINFPNIANTFNIDKQITAKTTSEVQNRDVDGNYIKITLNELKLISLELSKRLKETLGDNWEEKVLNYLESRGSSNQATSIAVLNAMSSKNLDEIETGDLTDRQYKKLKNIQSRIDKVTNNISRQLSLGLNMRRILREFATQGDIAGAIAETILPKNIREDIEAMKQSISREISDKELNTINRTVQPENPQEQKMPPQKETNKNELLNIAKSKLGKSENNRNDLKEIAKQIAEKINKTKCK